MPDDSNRGIDPRYDPRFQRGYDGDAERPQGAARTDRDAPRRSQRAAFERAAPIERVATSAERVAAPEPAAPEFTASESAASEPTFDDEPEVWVARQPGPDSSARRWLAGLWWIGGVLLALGVVSLAYGIWANNDTAGQPYQDFFITVFSSIAWQLYGPALTIGLATLVATAVLQTLAPGLRERR